MKFNSHTKSKIKCKVTAVELFDGIYLLKCSCGNKLGIFLPTDEAERKLNLGLDITPNDFEYAGNYYEFLQRVN